MTFEQAVLKATEDVFNAPLNLTTDEFNKKIKSLVVLTDNSYQAITVDNWRRLVDKISLIVLLNIGGPDSFGG